MFCSAVLHCAVPQNPSAPLFSLSVWPAQLCSGVETCPSVSACQSVTAGLPAAPCRHCASASLPNPIQPDTLFPASQPASQPASHSATQSTRHAEHRLSSQHTAPVSIIHHHRQHQHHTTPHHTTPPPSFLPLFRLLVPFLFLPFPTLLYHAFLHSYSFSPFLSAPLTRDTGLTTLTSPPTSQSQTTTHTPRERNRAEFERPIHTHTYHHNTGQGSALTKITRGANTPTSASSIYSPPWR